MPSPRAAACSFLTAHLGNWEAAGHLLSRLDAPVNVTGFDNETAENPLPPQSGLQGEIPPAPPHRVAHRYHSARGRPPPRRSGCHARRPRLRQPVAAVPFLGGAASFPVGAYVMAAIAGAPLVHVFSLREPGGRYHFFGFPPQYPEMPPHNQRDPYFALALLASPPISNPSSGATRSSGITLPVLESSRTRPPAPIATRTMPVPIETLIRTGRRCAGLTPC